MNRITRTRRLHALRPREKTTPVTVELYPWVTRIVAAVSEHAVLDVLLGHEPDAWEILFFEAADGTAPGYDFLTSCPDPVQAEFAATLRVVAEGPPPSFRGGLRFKPMRGTMTGWFEARTKHDKLLYRLFILMERSPPGRSKPCLVIVSGGVKANETAFSGRFYKEIRDLENEYLASNPRSVR